MAYALGLQRLGHDVFLIEDVYPKPGRPPNYRPPGFEEWKREGMQYFEWLTKSYGLWPRCCLIYNYGEATHGMSLRDAMEIAKAADLLIDIGTILRTPAILDNVPCRAYVDEAPGKTQVKHSDYGSYKGLDEHDFFFTVGLNIGLPDCPVPTCGLSWQGILHPVVLSLWPPQNEDWSMRFTTVSNWDKGTLLHKGRFSGGKMDHWLEFMDLPQNCGQQLELAMNFGRGYEAEAKLFMQHGWLLTDPGLLRNLDDYRSYIGKSRAEFSIANPRYVQLNTGWTSDRSARYLASGKPVLVQSTGIEDHLPTGKGLLTFGTMEEAVAGIESINGDYRAHCRAARAIAEEYFGSDKVLTKILEHMTF